MNLKYLQERLEGPFGYEFFLADSIDEARATKGLASSAHSFLNAGVSCVLVGLNEPAQALFQKGLEWLKKSITEDERPEPDFGCGTDALRFSDLALLTWLALGRHDQPSLDACVANHLAVFKARHGKDRDEAAQSAVDFVDAGRCEELQNVVQELRNYRHRPADETELDFALRLCGAGLVDSTVTSKFLQRHVKAWVSKGVFGRLAHWAKIVSPEGTSPFDAVVGVI